MEFKKIDRNQKTENNLYGLDNDGSFYEVKEDFYLEILESYQKTGEKYLGFSVIKPSWKQLKAYKNDIILVSKNNAFIKLKENDDYLICRPKDTKNTEYPNFSRFNENYLVKIGKKLERPKLMGDNEIKKIILIRSL